MYLTIRDFSEKTGLAPSTLRFYDRKKLLVPECRLENGYRAYSEEQISDAITIHSLRNADIQIDEIKHFLHADEYEKNSLLSKWRQEVEIKVSALKIAQQYLGGLSPKQIHIHLVRWEDPITFIWHRHTVSRKPRPFHEVMILDLEKLREKGYKGNTGFFVRQLHSTGQEITGEVGFILTQELFLNDLPENGYLEKLEPTLFASMECSTDNEFLCFQFIQMIKQFEFVPKGQKLEKYESPESDTFHYLVPIMKQI
ncbi:MerR family transcriptional regulator [Lederbergia sp. NSJ-179]|uniref:MerR family transcriptional regulator n=1 Tax=Lederbergia sp. NSJ-179 TaxID=2931402 RepID=UPI001FD25076|nr:MerR family transcriptional regulator [Lederbergia sp. NSJ-179]MCJ7843014.1 MerR family transcriptional regulator [Lederbergia sp. NSJ-179]